MTKTLQERIGAWKESGKRENEISYGMLCDGFQSIRGIPDDFYSAEDPADRVKFWERYQLENTEEYKIEQWRREGKCCHCGWNPCTCHLR